MCTTIVKYIGRYIRHVIIINNILFRLNTRPIVNATIILYNNTTIAGRDVDYQSHN